MSKICESFIEELSSPTHSRSAEFKAHLATCPECKMMAESLAGFVASRAPFSPAEQASIHKISTFVQKGMLSTSASAAKASSVASSGFVKAIGGILAVAGIVTAGLFFQETYEKPTPKVGDTLITVETRIPEPNPDIRISVETNFEKGDKLPIGKDSEFVFEEDSTLNKVSDNNFAFAAGKVSANHSRIDGTYTLTTPDADFEVIDAKFECTIRNSVVSLKVLSGIVKVMPKNGQKQQELKEGQHWESQIEENTSEESKTLIVNPGEEEINLPDGEN